SAWRCRATRVSTRASRRRGLISSAWRRCGRSNQSNHENTRAETTKKTKTWWKRGGCLSNPCSPSLKHPDAFGSLGPIILDWVVLFRIFVFRVFVILLYAFRTARRSPRRRGDGPGPGGFGPARAGRLLRPRARPGRLAAARPDAAAGGRPGGSAGRPGRR